MKVLKIELRPDNGKPLKAFADVELPDGTIIRAFRIIQEPGKRAAVHCPQASIKPAKDAPAYFKTLVILPEPLKGDVDLAILNAWKEARDRQNGKNHEERHPH